MRKRRMLWTIAVLAFGALTAGAVPAFTADNGNIAVTVTAQAAPAPCLTVSPGTVDFGTVPFSAPGSLAGRNSGITLENCGASNEHLTVAGTDATGPGGTWSLVTGSVNQCDGGVNKYGLVLSYYEAGDADYRIYNNVATTPTTVATGAGAPYVFAPTTPTPARIGISMPCQGSNGAGETKSLSVLFTAVTA